MLKIHLAFIHPHCGHVSFNRGLQNTTALLPLSDLSDHVRTSIVMLNARARALQPCGSTLNVAAAKLSCRRDGCILVVGQRVTRMDAFVFTLSGHESKLNAS